MILLWRTLNVVEVLLVCFEALWTESKSTVSNYCDGMGSGGVLHKCSAATAMAHGQRLLSPPPFFASSAHGSTPRAASLRGHSCLYSPTGGHQCVNLI